MKEVRFDKRKNLRLKRERGIDFETIIRIIQEDKLIAVLDHPNKDRYPNQKLFLVEVKNYVYIVPFIESENEIKIITIFPSRKYTKKYLKK